MNQYNPAEVCCNQPEQCVSECQHRDVFRARCNEAQCGAPIAEQACETFTRPAGAQEYAFDASNRIFETQQNAIEHEIIRARELGQREGCEKASWQYEKELSQLRAIVRNYQAHIACMTQPKILYVGFTQADIDTAVARATYGVHELRECYDRQIDTIAELQQTRDRLVADNTRLQEENGRHFGKIVELEVLAAKLANKLMRCLYR